MKNKKFKIYRVLFIAWSIILFTLTSIPKLSAPSTGILGIDKLAHFGVYMVFAYLLVKSLNREQGSLIKILIVAALLIPLADELHQIPIPGREFSVYDIFADMAGFAIIILLVKIDRLRSIRN